jgi:hypothetical protein
MLPETLPTGVEVTIRNALTGDLKTVPVVNGGWDPVAIAARPGDTVRIAVKTAEGQSQEYANIIPLHRRPMILRTEPQSGLNDARLNTPMVVVFSEPIDQTTATRARVQLRRRGLPVANDISFSTSGLEMQIRPEGGLAPVSSYALVVTAELADQQGDRLEKGVQVEFTTGTSFRDIAPGTYDLSARITSFDPAWGNDLTDSRYTAVLSIEKTSPDFKGTFRDMWLIGPGGDAVNIASYGVITRYLDDAGRYVLDLVRPEGEMGSSFTLTLVLDDPNLETIEGSWGCCGHIGGHFTLKPRVP